MKFQILIENDLSIKIEIINEFHISYLTFLKLNLK